ENQNENKIKKTLSLQLNIEEEEINTNSNQIEEEKKEPLLLINTEEENKEEEIKITNPEQEINYEKYKSMNEKKKKLFIETEEEGKTENELEIKLKENTKEETEEENILVSDLKIKKTKSEDIIKESKSPLNIFSKESEKKIENLEKEEEHTSEEDEEEDEDDIPAAPLTSKHSACTSFNFKSKVFNFSVIKPEEVSNPLTKSTDVYPEEKTYNSNKKENLNNSILDSNDYLNQYSRKHSKSAHIAMLLLKNNRNKRLKLITPKERLSFKKYRSLHVKKGRKIKNKEGLDDFTAISSFSFDNNKEMNLTPIRSPFYGSTKILAKSLLIDTDRINREALLHELQFKDKVFLLAKHCVDFMEGRDTKENCNDDKYDRNIHIDNEIKKEKKLNKRGIPIPKENKKRRSSKENNLKKSTELRKNDLIISIEEDTVNENVKPSPMDINLMDKLILEKKESKISPSNEENTPTKKIYNSPHKKSFEKGIKKDNELYPYFSGDVDMDLGKDILISPIKDKDKMNQRRASDDIPNIKDKTYKELKELREECMDIHFNFFDKPHLSADTQDEQIEDKTKVLKSENTFKPRIRKSRQRKTEDKNINRNILRKNTTGEFNFIHIFNDDVYKIEIKKLFCKLLEWFKSDIQSNIKIEMENKKNFLNCLIRILGKANDIELINTFLNESPKLMDEKIIYFYHNTFWQFLLETSFHCFLILEKNYIQSPLIQGKNLKDLEPMLKSARIKSKKQFIDCFIKVVKDEQDKKTNNKWHITKPEKLKRQLNFLLNWGIYMKSLITENSEYYNSVFEFIRDILSDTLRLEEFKSKDLVVNEFYLNLVSYIYEFVVLFRKSETILTKGEAFLDKLSVSSKIGIILPSFFSAGVVSKRSSESVGNEIQNTNTTDNSTQKASSTSSEINPLDNLWENYSLFQEVYDYYNEICSFVGIPFLEKLQFYDSGIIMFTKEECDDIIEGFVLNSHKVKHHLFLDGLDTLLFHNDNSGHYGRDSQKDSQYEERFNIFHIVSNLIVMTISLSSVKGEKSFWLNELQNFIIFCITVSTARNNVSNSYEKGIFFQVIAFDLAFLIDQFYMTQSLEEEHELFKDVIENVLFFLASFKYYVYKSNIKKKNFFWKNVDIGGTPIHKILELGSKKDKEKNKNKDNIKVNQTNVAQIAQIEPLFQLNTSSSNEMISERLNSSGGELEDSPHRYGHSLSFGDLSSSSSNTNEQDKFAFLSIEDIKQIVENRECVENYLKINESEIRKLILENPEIKRKIEPLFSRDKFKTIVNKRYEKISEIIPFYSYKGIINMKFENDDGLGDELLIKKYNQCITQEFVNMRENIFKFIFENLPNYEKKFLIEEQSVVNNDELKKKIIYKKIKKNLFSFQGSWNDYNIFFSDKKKLKFKNTNHYTREFSRPILVPILDIDYYLPKFSKFNTEGLFMTQKNKKTEDMYKIVLDINKIFNEDVLEEKEDPLLNLKLKECLIKEDSTLLKALYIYIEQEKSVKSQKYQMKCKENLSDSNESEEDQKKIKQTIFDNIPNNLQNNQNKIPVCLVKQTHHIKGEIYLSPTYFKFSLIKNNEDPSKENDYDCDRDNCFGSYFKSQKSDIEKSNLKIRLSKITLVFKRRYFYCADSVEIFTTKNKSYFFKFKSKKDRDYFLCFIKKFIEPLKEIKIDGKEKINLESIIGYYNPNNVILPKDIKEYKDKPFYASSSSLFDYYKKRRISNFEFIMWVNFFSNRSYLDLTQYPVFPWILSNYDADKLANVSYRNFKLPMGMMELNEKGSLRKESYAENYNLMIDEIFNDDKFLEEDQEKFTTKLPERLIEKIYTQVDVGKRPYYYGSHYSNPTYIAHFLLRLFPYSLVMLEIQGERFDDPQRLFFNLKNSFESATTQKCDIRELCPEFFCLPEMFLNLNKFNFGEASTSDEKDGKIFTVDNVSLPLWCNNDPFKFAFVYRDYLEKDNCEFMYWIDLIFGSRQRGKKALEACNVFIHHTYENVIDISSIDNEDQVNYFLRLVELGMTPHQTFFKDMLPKKESIIPTIHRINDLEDYEITSKYLLGNSNKLSPTFVVESEYLSLSLLYPDLSKANIKLQFSTTELKISGDSEIPPLKIINNKINEDSFTLSKYHSFKYQSYNVYPKAYASYDKGNYIVIGGYVDGSLFLLTPKDVKTILNGNSHFERSNFNSNVDNSPILIIKMNDTENMSFCGSQLGTIFVFEIKNKENWILLRYINHHMDSISYICYSSSLNLLASSSYDGYINVYLFPSFKLVNSISEKQRVDNVFLSICPLPCIVTYIKSNMKFKSYSINGNIISTENQMEKEEISEGGLITPNIYSDKTFNEYLLYGNTNGCIVIRKFPYMQIINKWNIYSDNSIRYVILSEKKNLCYVIGKNNKMH
ncbi:MAG: hypothetical protein MJ252_03765, partial [archaeon]|nr:hypothetical protein [archaeon]